ncbi:MurR/RpiR family transcriptional regulator [Lacticaseibacillus paracasei]|uniref:MurR/RpiR family transcriptional regulator n=1 Tax=Lacticaseibacillus paracasei TaxID=1597 RepID=UPI0007BFE567|nr:MurR/RpiR family transcriptional regulator [Lacticaseibacillus paracasei]URW91784.1 MurR/RpiR family transcriptional regulator [Lacticaseibacillus paracasei]
MSTLSPTEDYLWNYIHSHSNQVAVWTITELSDHANVSTATIVRAMKKRGYSGYSDFRHSHLSQKRDSIRYSILSQVDGQIRNVIMQNEVELTNTLANLNISTIEDTIHLIKQADTVYIFARGPSEPTADEMCLKLELLGKNAQYFHDPNVIRQISKRIHHSSMVIFISLNGKTEELVEAAHNLNKEDVPIVVLTTVEDSPLARISDELFLGFQSGVTMFNHYEVHSRLPLQIMSRILLDSYVIRTQ